MAKRKTMQQWITEVLADNEQETKLTQLTLVHMRGNSPAEIHTCKAKTLDASTPERLATLITDKANTYSQDLPGVQTFNILAFYGSDAPSAQFPFLVRPDADVQFGGLSTEPPTPTGELQQRMRWREMDQGIIYRQQTTLYEQSLRTMQMMSATIEKMMAERFQTADMMIDLMTRMADSQHGNRMKELEFERSSKNQEVLLKLAPPIVNQLTQKEIFPQATEDTAIIEAFAERLIESMNEQGDAGPLGMMQKIAELGLPDAMMGILSARIMKIIDRKQKEASAKKVSLSLVKDADPSLDVGGGKK